MITVIKEFIFKTITKLLFLYLIQYLSSRKNHVTSAKLVKRQLQQHKWSENERCNTGKHAAENGNINALRKFIQIWAWKEIEFLYLHDIASKVEKYNISSTLVVNINITQVKYVPVGNETMAAKGEHSVMIGGSADKCSVTGIFAILFDGNFLPVQLIYCGKTTQCLSRFEFPKDFSLSTNPKSHQALTKAGPEMLCGSESTSHRGHLYCSNDNSCI